MLCERWIWNKTFMEILILYQKLSWWTSWHKFSHMFQNFRMCNYQIQLHSFTSLRISFTILLCFVYVLYIAWPFLWDRLTCGHITDLISGSRATSIWFLQDDWFQPSMQNSTESIPVKLPKLRNVPWLSSLLLYCLNPWWRYFYRDLPQLHVLTLVSTISSGAKNCFSLFSTGDIMSLL